MTAGLDFGREDLVAARELVDEARVLLRRASVHLAAVRDVQPRTRKGHLAKGARNVWGPQNAVTSMLGHAGTALLVLDQELER